MSSVIINETNAQLGHATWTDEYGVIHYLTYTYRRYYEAERALWNPLTARALFARHWHWSVGFALVYVASIFGLRRWMRDRKPYDLKTPLALWNGFLAVFSAMGFWRLGEEFHFVLAERSFKDSVCRSIDPNGPAAFWAFLFTLSKVFELLDTVFVVLRKRPLIFLHWYHHAIVLVYSWHGAVVLTAASRWFIYMNYGVHAIMYAYYAAASAGARPPRSFSMVVTSLQTAQMLVGVGISVFIATLKYEDKTRAIGASAAFGGNSTTAIGANGNGIIGRNGEFLCQHTDANLAFCFAIYASFALLFMNFFRAAYFGGGGGGAAAKKGGVTTNGKANVDVLLSAKANADIFLKARGDGSTNGKAAMGNGRSLANGKSKAE